MAGSLDFARDDEPVRHGSSAIPRAIEVHIEELVLYGFQPNDRWRIGDALEAELRSLLANQGFPDSWRNNPEKVYAGKVHLTNRAQIGRQIAAAIHGGARQ